MNSGKQILKSREDTQPVFLSKSKRLKNSNQPFILEKNCVCSWLKKGESCDPLKLRSRIEPWLAALWQSEHISLLLGSGLTHAVYNLATGGELHGMEKVEFGEHNEIINKEADNLANSVGRGEGNIEDQIRVANELIRGLEILKHQGNNYGKESVQLQEKLSENMENFTNSILQAERNIYSANKREREKSFNYLVSFLMSMASRTGNRDRLHLFTTNYDRVIETGAELAGMHLLDRFVGEISPIFRSSRLDLDLHYNPPGIRGEPRYLEGVARFTKLHGSLDWVNIDQNIRRLGLPFGAKTLNPYLPQSNSENKNYMQLMIYPNAAKDRETTDYPYVELFRDFAAAICRPNHTLVTYGYGFGDEHINRVIEDMLTIPSTHLVAISYDDPHKRIMGMYERLGRHAQISLLIGNHIGEFQALVDHYLPKPAIDRTTMRMAELLKSRLGIGKDSDAGKKSSRNKQ